jgi:hypothetical protein
MFEHRNQSALSHPEIALMPTGPITWKARAPRSGVPAAIYGCEWLDLLSATLAKQTNVTLEIRYTDQYKMDQKSLLQLIKHSNHSRQYILGQN